MDHAIERRRLLLAAPLLLTGLGCATREPVGPPQAPPVEVKLDVPYVPTPTEVVQRMLQLARVQRDDFVYDLGCGDGRIVIAAAKQHGARGTGIDIDPERVREARENARREGVAQLVNFEVNDIFKSDFSRATVVMLYLLSSINERLRPQLWQQLRVGTRVVSHEFAMGDAWPPEHTEMLDGRRIHAWTIREQHKRG